MESHYGNVLLHADFNLTILSYMDDDTLHNLCKCNPYFNTLCNNKELWQLKIMYMHPDFLTYYCKSIGKQNAEFYKKLYYHFKNHKYTDISKTFYILWLKNEISKITFIGIDRWLHMFQPIFMIKTPINLDFDGDKHNLWRK